MFKTPSLLIIPSIHNIIEQDKSANFDKQVKQLFRPQSYPIFPITDLINHPNYKSDQRFYIISKQLQDWNKRVDKNQIPKDGKAQLYRNQFLFTSLKNIMTQNSKGTKNYETNINKLYEWWRKNSKQQIPMYFSGAKKTKQDQDWQVRKTFKSNMPLEIKNYERRIMFATHEDYNKFYPNIKQAISHDKLVDYSGIKQYKTKQFKQRQVREQNEIDHAKTLLKTMQGRFNQDHCQHNQYFQSKLNPLSKTTTFFNRNDKINTKTKDQISRSFLQQRTEEVENIKRYRLNYSISKKDPFFRDLDRDLNNNKTTMSYSSSKPFDLTATGFDLNLFNTEKSSFGKQNSINNDYFSNYKSAIKEEKQNTLQFTEFQQIKNWQGQQLMSNPFEHKKQLKKKRKP